MIDLISRQMTIDALIKWYGCEPTDIGAFENIIEKLPSADAVPVVRCKDCKWFETNYIWNGWKCKVCGIEPDCSIRELDDICSRGERKDDVSDTDVGKKDESTMGQQNEVEE